ncbi:MAG: hypothetical protein R6X33_02795 [Candidatus Brocadiia bacterium]
MPTGIEIGAEAVYGVRMGQGRRPVREVEVPLVRAPRDFSAQSGLRDALRNAARSLRVGLSPVAVTGNLTTVVARVRLPFADPARIDDVIDFHVEERLPFDVADWAVDYEVARRVDDGVEVLVFATRRDEVSRLLETCAQAGVYPQAVVPRAEALFHLVAPEEDAGPVAAVWLDGASADFVVGSGSRLQFARSVPAGDEEQAAGPDVTPAVRVCLWTAGVADEECPVYVGGESLAAEAALDDLRAELPAPVHPAAGAPSSDRDQQEEQGPYGLAIGAALSLRGEDTVDLARTVRGPATALRAMVRPLTAFLVVVLVAGCLFLGYEYRRREHVMRAESANREALRAMWDRLYPGEPIPQDPLMRVRSDLAGVTRRGEGEDAVAAVDPLPVLQRTLQALPDLTGMEIHEFNVSSGTLVLDCRARSLGAADRVVDALQKELGVTVTAANPESLGGGQYGFKIRMRWEDESALR